MLSGLWFDLKDGFTILTANCFPFNSLLWFDLKDGFTILKLLDVTLHFGCGLI